MTTDGKALVAKRFFYLGEDNERARAEAAPLTRLESNKLMKAELARLQLGQFFVGKFYERVAKYSNVEVDESKSYIVLRMLAVAHQRLDQGSCLQKLSSVKRMALQLRHRLLAPTKTIWNGV